MRRLYPKLIAADAIVIAPATANFLAKAAVGLADDEAMTRWLQRFPAPAVLALSGLFVGIGFGATAWALEPDREEEAIRLLLDGGRVLVEWNRTGGYAEDPANTHFYGGYDDETV